MTLTYAAAAAGITVCFEMKRVIHRNFSVNAIFNMIQPKPTKSHLLAADGW